MLLFHGVARVVAVSALGLFMQITSSPQRNGVRINPTPRDDPALDAVIREIEGELYAAKKALPPTHPRVVELRLRLGDLHQSKYDLSAARTEYQLLLRDLAKADPADDIHRAMEKARVGLVSVFVEYGEFFQRENSLVMAEYALEDGKQETLRLAEPERHRAVGRLHHALGRLYWTRGKQEPARTELQRAESIARGLGAAGVDLGKVLLDLGLLEQSLGNKDRAEALLDQAASLLRDAASKEEDVVDRLRRLARTFQDRGDLDRARDLLRECLARLSGRPDASAEADDIRLSLAEILHEKADYRGARQRLARARSSTLPERRARALCILASLDRIQGEYAEGQAKADQCLTLLQSLPSGDPLLLAAAHREVAHQRRARGDYGAAVQHMSQAIEIHIRRLAPGDLQLVQTRYELGRLQALGGNYEDAVKTLLPIVGGVRRDAPSRRLNVKICTALAEAQLSLGHYELARTLFSTATEEGRSLVGESGHLVAGAHQGLGEVQRLTGALAESRASLERAVSLREGSLPPSHPDLAFTLSSLVSLTLAEMAASPASVLELERRLLGYQRRINDILEQNIEAVFSFGGEEDRLAFMATIESELHRTVSLVPRCSQLRKQAVKLALETLLRWKGRVLEATTDSYARIRRKMAPENREVLEDLRRARSEFSAHWLQPPRLGGRYGRRFQELKEEIRGLEDALSRRSREFAAADGPVDLERLRQALPANAALIEFARYGESSAGRDQPLAARYGAFVVRREGPVHWENLGPALRVDDAVRRFRQSIANPQSSAFLDHSRDIYRLLFGKLIERAGPSTLLLVAPDGALNLLPLAALHDGRQFLLDTHDVVYLTSGRELIHMSTDAPIRENAAIFADPSYGPLPTLDSRPSWLTGFEPLPGARSEGKAIADLLYDARLYIGSEASESALRQLAGPSVLHLATHGFFLADPPPVKPPSTARAIVDEVPVPQRVRAANPMLRSGLALAGANSASVTGGEGILLALEASSLDLWGTRLVVLAACETGLGDIRNGEGVRGLRRAMSLAGAQSQISSLWWVDDRSTRDLMTTFYRGLLQGQGRAQALRGSQLAVRQIHPHPYYWAAFQLSGAWQPIGITTVGERPKP